MKQIEKYALVKQVLLGFVKQNLNSESLPVDIVFLQEENSASNSCKTFTISYLLFFLKILFTIKAISYEIIDIGTGTKTVP